MLTEATVCEVRAERVRNLRVSCGLSEDDEGLRPPSRLLHIYSTEVSSPQCAPILQKYSLVPSFHIGPERFIEPDLVAF